MKDFIKSIEEKIASLAEARNAELLYMRQNGYDFTRDSLIRSYEHTISALEVSIRELKALDAKL